ncbi:bacteriocin fulvocin C-related protein [Streptomyces sp. NPDC006552]|uniref:bacteriocin fulvocin C-related protein n=1 Tax=Streptomyces sp. NPDC006552 TaxID=3157179 RepID=UPI0033B3AC47
MTEWLLAFDADCRFCEDVVDRVRESVDGTLTTAGLAEPRVRELRARALGDGAVWAPTLLAVDGERVRAWTGTALSVRLARLLGPADSLRVVRALGDLRPLRAPSRRGLLKAVPGLALGTFLVTGGLATSPAQAVTRARSSRATRWVQANLGRLPSAYAEFTSYPADYRRAVYGALSPAARGDLWVAHFAHYRKAHPALSAAQSAVLDDATRLAPQIIAGRRQADALEGLRTATVAAFGASGSRALLMELGPKGEPAVTPRGDRSLPAADCNSQCAGTGSCDSVCYGSCNWTDYGCGPLWLGPCSGLCN